MFVVLISSLSFAFASDVSGNMTLSDSNDQNTIETADIQEDVLGEGEKSFSQLDSLINNESVIEGGHVDLDDGYSFYDSDSASVGTNGISINKSITVDGKMHTLDASGKSSIFRIGNNSHVILQNIIFTNGNGTDGGAIYVESGSSVEIINCTFQNNFASHNGGAIFTAADSTSISTIYNSIFTQNSAATGGAIYDTASTLNVISSSFSYNVASKYGGSMYAGGAVNICDTIFDHERASGGGAIDLVNTIGKYSTIENSTFQNCNATGDGGAAYIRSDNVAVKNVKFLDNTAGDDGGAIYWEGSNGIIYNITCTNNKGISLDKNSTDTSSTRGGAICLTGGNVTISKSSFTSNSAYMDEGKNSSKVDGGAVFITGNGVTIDDVTFKDNSATNNGGALYVIGNGTKIINCDFTVSDAKDGAALYVEGKDCNLYNSTFTNNIAKDDGGAIYWDGDEGLMYNITCTNNKGISSGSSSSRGGAICLTGENVTISKSSFTSNSAYMDEGKDSSKVDGGAVFVTGNGVTIDDVTFDGNHATNNGGAVYVIGNHTDIVDCDFINSNAKDGAALFVNGTDCEVYNSTFTKNVADDDGGAIFWEGDRGLMYNITCTNNKGISSGDSSSRGGTICLSGDNVTVTNSSFKTSSVSIAAGRDSSKIDGGALFITGNNVNVIDSDFYDCTATHYGGAMYILGNNSQILGCTVNNTKALVGGGIFIAGDDGVVDNSVFRKNNAAGKTQADGGTGGAVYVEGDRGTISNSDFADGSAVNYGGAIAVWGADAIITNNTFDNYNTALYYGGSIYVNGYNATISLSNFTRSTAKNKFAQGGAIQISGDAADILDCNFEDCFAYFGGVIHISGSDAFVNNSDFKHSVTFKPTGTSRTQYPQNGGAIYVNGTSATIFKSNFTDFTSEDYGGAIYVAGANANISESDFQNCIVRNHDGGAIYITGADTTIEESHFESCDANRVAGQLGGAICINGANTLIKGSEFEDCEAKKGGDIYVFGNSARIEDSTFNVSDAEYGGAIYLDAWGAVIKDSNITSCYATKSGGAIYVAGGGTNIIGSSFEDCEARQNSFTDGGGAIYITGPDTHISDSDFNGNWVTGSRARGGTIYINGARTIIDGSYFNDSFAAEGGIIYIQGEYAVIDSSTFANSSSSSYGGAISVHGHNATIRGSDFENVKSTGSSGGAIYVDGAGTNILYSSFDNTVAKSGGGAIYIADIETTVAYSNFTHASANTGGAIYIDGVNTIISYCNINNNTATSAGAIKVLGNDSYISNCNISYNNAISGAGGAVDIGGERASVLYSYYSFNKATDNGGAINWQGGHGSDSIIGTTFVNNTSTGPQGGGAIFWTQGGTIASGGLIKDCVFINNSALNKHGGALNWYRTIDSTIDNCLFVNNYASSDGGALYTGDQNGNSRNLTFINSQFYNNTAAKHGGAIANQMAESYIFNITFDGNKAGFSGGSILMKEGPAKGTVIDHCYIYNSYCDYKGDKYGDGGGAIHIQDESITISNCAIINSTANKTYGGAIAFEFKTNEKSRTARYGSLINVTIQNVKTNGDNGGAIYWSGDYGYMYNVTIFNSSSNSNYNTEANGGAIYLSGSNGNFNNVTITSSSSNNNNSGKSNPANGGAIYVSGKSNTFTNLTIDESQASSVRMDANGGAIYWSGSSGTLINATISNTLANGKGGAIYWSGSAKTFENISIEYSQTNVTSTSIENNGCGGAIYTTTLDKMKNVYIIDALASTDSGDIKGGAIYYAGSKMDNVTVIGSRAMTGEGTSYGGAVYLQAGSTTDILNSLFKENTADLGGALFTDRTTNIYTTEFIGNVAVDGGAIYAQTGDITISDSIFELNSAKRGGALFAEEVNFKIDDSTLRNNTAEGEGGAIYNNYASSGGSSYIKNSDLVNNTAFQGSAIYTLKFFKLTNVVLLDNQANSKEFIDKHVGVDETGRNYTSAVFVGFDNVLNAIWVEENTINIACTNVTYWGVNGVNVSNSVPRRSDREVWQNVTIEMFNEEGAKIKESQVVTDADGRCIYYFNAEPGKTYYFAYTHETDRYYTYLRETLANRSLVKVYVYNPLYYQQNQSILISLTDGAWGDLNGTVNVTMKGPYNKTFIIEVINGTYRIENISGLPLGDYNVSASYDGDIDHTGDSDWVLFTVLPYDDLHITKDVNITADLVNVSDIIKYTINVTNHGPSDAIGVNVTEILSPYLELLDNKTTRGYYNYTNGTWFIGNLDVDETVTLTIIAKIIHMGPITNTVWVTGLGNDTNITNNIDSAHNFTAVPLTDLNITKEVNVTGDTINVLDRLKFTITVSNYGPSNATGVIVAENLNDHLKLISYETSDNSIYENGTWHIGTLANGANVTLTIVAEVIYSGNITNAVRVSGFENETNYTNNYDSIKNITAIANVDVGIIKTVNVTGFVNVTDLIQFNITVFNNGPCNASGVFVKEALDEAYLEMVSFNATRGDYNGYTWVIDNLNKGDLLNLTIIAKVINVGNFGNAVSIFSIDNDTNTSNNNDSIDNITSLPIVDLSIVKEVNGGSVVNVSDEIVFKITVRNNGPWDATNVTVVEVLSPHLEMTSNSTWGGFYNATSGIWYIGDLAKDDWRELVIVAKVISPGIISNVVVVNSTENDTNKSNNNDTIKNITALPVVDLAITKEVNVAVVNVSGRITFTINVTNYGPCNATQVYVNEVLSPELKLISNVTENGYYNVTEGIWHIGNLNNGSNATLTLVCEVMGNGTIVNYVNVTSYENDTDLSNNEYEVIFLANPIVDVSITKEVNVTAVDFVYLGDKIQFTITIHNAGPSNATGVWVSEILDIAHLRLVSYNATKGTYDNATWKDIGKLNNGSTETLTIVAEVISLGNITNAVTVYSTEDDTNMSNNNDTIDNITVTPIVDLAITKTVDFGSGVVNVGNLVQFTINVVNNGPCDATNVTVVEVLSPLLKMTGHLINKGEYNVTSGIWYIGDLATKNTGDFAQLTIQARVISNGTISNFVAVTSNETDTNKSNNNDTIDNITALPIVDLAITKQVSASVVNVSDRIKFTINVTNNGPCNATHVNVSEILGPHLKLISNVTEHGYYNVTDGIWYIGDLTNHTNATLAIVCEAIRQGAYVNYVEVSSYENDTNPYNNHKDVPFTISPVVDVSIKKEVNVTGFVNVTDEIKFTITVHNDGPCNATSVMVLETLDSHLGLVSYKASKGEYNGVSWFIGDLNSGDNATLNITAKVKYAGNFSNMVNVSSYEADTNMSNNYDNITNITALYLVDLAITKTANIWGAAGNVAKVGDIIQFNINVYNYGPCDATNVTVVEVLDSHLELYGDVPGYNVTSGIWYVGDLPDEGSAQLIILAKVISPGTISNFVSINSTENDTNKSNNNDTIDNITALPVVDLVINKQTNVSIVTIGDKIEFNITVYNKGPCNATQVNVSEILENDFELISAITPNGYYNHTGGYWYIGNLTVGATANLTIICELKADGIYSNYVEASSYENDTYPYDNWDIVYVSTTPIVDVSITKRVNVTTNIVNVGELIEFTITVHNDGPSDATSVIVGEIITEPLHLVSSNPSIGSYSEGTWNVGNLANNATETLTLVCKVMYTADITNFVNVTSYQNDTNMSNNYDNITNLTAAVNVDVGIIKTVNVTGTVHVGDYVEFNITVYNNGPCNATSVSVVEILDLNHLELKSNVTTKGPYNGYSWDIGTLNMGETVNMTLVVRVKAPGVFTNYVNVTSFENDTNRSNNEANITNITALPAVDLEITKVVTKGAGVVNVTDLVQFIITVVNKGPCDATNVTVVEVLSPHLNMTALSVHMGEYNVTSGIWYIGDLAANTGDFAQLTIEAMVISNGTISNFVAVTSNETDRNESNNNDTIENITALPLVDVNITKEVNVTSGFVNVGDEVKFTIVVHNNGPSNATDVVAYDKLSGLLEFARFVSSRDGITYDDKTGKITIGNLYNNETVTLNIIAKVIGNGTVDNKVNVTSHENDTNKSNNNDSSDNFTALPVVDLNITKEVNVTVAFVGDFVRYTIVVHNNGPSNATDVVSYDKLSDLLEFVRFTSSRDDITYDNKTGKITIGNLYDNETVTLNIIAKVIRNGTIPNAVNVTGHENDTNKSNNNDSSDNITALPLVDLVITKEVNVTTGFVNVGDKVKFTITVHNNGPSNATGVNVTEVLSPLLRMDSNVTDYGYYDVREGVWHIGKLNNGSTAVLTIVCKVIGNGTIANFVVVNSTENETNNSDNNDTIDNITSLPVVDVLVNKTVNVTQAYVGDTIIYIITVHNNGPSNATDVNVTEKLSNLVTFVDADPSIGTYDSANNIWHVGALNNGSTQTLTLKVRIAKHGVIENVVIVNSTENDTNKTNNNYTSDNVTTISLDTPIILDTYNITYGDDEILHVYLPENATGTVNITVNGVPYNNVPLNDGVAELPLINPAGGDYHVEVVYGGDRNYVPNSTSGDFNVAPLTPVIIIYVNDIWHGEIEVANVTVTAPGTVFVTIAGITVEIPLENGVKTTDVLKASFKSDYLGNATWNLLNLPVGRYPAYAYYPGNENYTSVSNSSLFYVRDLPSTVVVTADDIYVGEDAFINIQVGPKDFNGTVDVIIEGKVYNNVKLVNGKANLTLSGLKAGLKHVYVKFNGTIVYRPSENTTTFKVLKLKPPVNVDAPTIKVGEDGVITVTVPEDATGTITIKVNGKTYTQPIKNGKAVFVIPGLEVGVHDIVAFYSGDEKYLPNNATGTIEVTSGNGSGHGHGSGLSRHATGNPIFALVVVIMTFVWVPIRRFKK